MKRIFTAAMGAMVLAALTTTARAGPCLVVTLTGTQGGPTVFNGQAGAGTLECGFRRAAVKGELRQLDLWPSPTNYGGFNQPSCFSVMPTVLSPVAEEG